MTAGGGGSIGAGVASRDGVGRPGAWVLIPAGVGLLLIRPLFAFGPGGVWLLAAVYLTIAMASILAVRTGSEGFAIRPPAGSVLILAGALGIGLGAFVLAAVGQRTIHVSAGPAAVTLTALASVAEEAFFRGFLYQRLARFGAPLAIVAGAGAFALVHVLAYPPAAIWVDFGAGLMLGWQRWITGSWLVPAATHLGANLLVVMA